MTNFRYRAEYWLVLTLFALLKRIPPETLSRLLAPLLRWIGPKTSVQKRILANLARIKPEMSVAEHHEFARKVWYNWGCMVAELPHLEALCDPMGPHIKLENRDSYDRIQAEGRGVLFVGAHFGNWEATVVYTGYVVGPCIGFYRPLKNPFIDTWLKRRREATGVRMISRGDRSALRDSISQLRKGGVAALLIDQRLDGAPDIPFMGAPAPTMPLPYSLAASTGAAVMTAEVRRNRPDEGYGFTARLGDEIELPKTGNKVTDQRAFLTEINAQVEAMVARAPEQWFWAHRRWSRMTADATGDERAKREL